jgi:hypothetical protein
MRIEIPEFDKVSGGFEPLPVGEYVCRIDGAEKVNTPAGTSYIAWSASVMEGEHTGRKLFWNTSLQPQALWNVKALLVALGAPMDASGFNTEDCIGRKVILTVDVEEYQGRARNRVGGTYLPVQE